MVRMTIFGTSGSDFIHVSGDGYSNPGGYDESQHTTNDDDVVDVSQGGTDIVHAGDGYDRIYMGGTLTAADRIDGGFGLFGDNVNDNDRVELFGYYAYYAVFGQPPHNFAVTFNATTLTNVEELILDGGTTPSGLAAAYDLTLAAETNPAGHRLNVNAQGLSTANFLSLDGSRVAGNLLIQSHTNQLTAVGGSGNDSISLIAAPLLATSTINGGPGTDTLTLGSANSSVVFNAGTVTNIETIKLLPNSGGDVNPASYALTLASGTVGPGNAMTIDATFLHGIDHVTVNAQLMAGGTLTLLGGGEDDYWVGGDNAVYIFAGNDGNDTFVFNTPFSALQRIDGGAGGDTLVLNGSGIDRYVPVQPTTLTGVETIDINGGGHYTWITNDASVASGAALTVDATGFTEAGSRFTFDASAETNGRYIFQVASDFNSLFGGTGNDSFTELGGGAGAFDITRGGNDTVIAGDGADTIYGGPSFNAADVVDGGGGADMLLLDGNYNLALGALSFSDIETLLLGTRIGASPQSYAIVTADGNVAAGAVLTVDATALPSNAPLNFNGGNETDGAFDIRGGDANDTLAGGRGNDRFAGGNGADTMSGGAGDDTYVGPVAGADTIVEAAGAAGGLHDTIVSGASVSLGALPNVEEIALIGKAAINGSGNNAANTIIGNGLANILNGGGGNDILQGGRGADTLNGGNGADLFRFDKINTGADTIVGFSTAQDRFDMGGGTFSSRVESGGDTTLTHGGGTIVVAGVTGLSLAQWKVLIVSGAREAEAAPSEPIHHEATFTGRFAAPVPEPLTASDHGLSGIHGIHFAAHADFL